ncbi:MAG: SpoIIE family protein phosphatase [Crocinitomix sp.]|nr:SpoIIE family protein phosphatase [Crocinitomix sp.]
MKTKLKYLIPILLLAACTGNRKSDEAPAPLFPQPQTVELNTGEGYAINPITRDTIQPLVNSLGDTLLTGVPITAIGTVINPDSVSKPKVVRGTEPVEMNAHPNVHHILDNLTVIPVNKDSLTTFQLQEIANNDTLHYILNSTGDTIPTGTPILTQGKSAPTTQPTPTKALPPGFKDAANINMQYLDVDQGMASSYVYSILEDKSGNLWFGTYGGGVSRYDGKSFTHFTEKEGLSNNSVWSILEDKSGNLWFSTESGINMVKQEKLALINDKSNTVLFNTFEKNDGLKGLDFYSNSVCLDSENRIWWGSGKSLTMLDMNKFSSATEPPAVYLRQLDINEAFIDYHNITDSLGNHIAFNSVQTFENYPLNIELPYDKNHLTFHFSAIDWGAPHKIQYSYIMEGLNTTWSQPSADAKADYRNLPYGTYIFKIRAIGASGDWSEAFEYEFTIHPPWWHTWWARTLYGIVALMLIFGFVRWRTSKLKARQKELEIEVENATSDLLKKNQEISKQKEIVEEAHKEITDSINYAERIQRSFLATSELLDQNLNEYFVYFQPKEVVSGDFYWAGKLANGNFSIVNADSTGHGVPGAIMSILNISSIEKAVEKNATRPAEIFNQTRKTIIERLKKDGSPDGGKDGMDASLISFNSDKTKMTYVAAQNPIWVIRNGELIEIKPEKMPVGKHDHDNTPFEGGEYNIQKGDQIYTLTDGFQDQFGGPKGKKFMVKKMREYVLSISDLSMKEQHQKIEDTFTNWKGDLEQVDDVCVIGIKI